MTTSLVLPKSKVWGALRYNPNPAQQRMHRSQARNRVVSAGRRTGKSTGWGHELTVEGIRAQFMRQYYEDNGIRSEHWIVGPNYTDSEKEFRVVYNDCKRLKMPFDRPGTYYTARTGDMVISLWGGTFLVLAKSAAHPDSLVGEGLHSVNMTEAAKMKESVWSKSIRPALADFGGGARFDSTPEGRNWYYDLWKLGQDPNRPDWWSGRFPSWYNNRIFGEVTTAEGVKALKELGEKGKSLLTPANIAALPVHPEIASMYLDLGPLMFAQEVEAKFGQYVGRVFADWDEEVHCRKLNYDPKLPVYICTDYGWTNPAVALFIQVNVWDDVFVIAEYYETHRTDEEMASDILGDAVLGPLTRKARMLYPDPEDPKASTTLARAWKVNIGPSTGGLRKDRLNLIRRWLKITNKHLPWGHPERRPKLFVDSQMCPHLTREMDAYRYPSSTSESRSAPEEPMDKDNHAPEALGRFFGGHYGRRVGSNQTRQSQAVFAR